MFSSLEILFWILFNNAIIVGAYYAYRWYINFKQDLKQQRRLTYYNSLLSSISIGMSISNVIFSRTRCNANCVTPHCSSYPVRRQGVPARHPIVFPPRYPIVFPSRNTFHHVPRKIPIINKHHIECPYDIPVRRERSFLNRIFDTFFKDPHTIIKIVMGCPIIIKLLTSLLPKVVDVEVIKEQARILFTSVRCSPLFEQIIIPLFNSHNPFAEDVPSRYSSMEDINKILSSLSNDQQVNAQPHEQNIPLNDHVPDNQHDESPSFGGNAAAPVKPTVQEPFPELILSMMSSIMGTLNNTNKSSNNDPMALVTSILSSPEIKQILNPRNICVNVPEQPVTGFSLEIPPSNFATSAKNASDSPLAEVELKYIRDDNDVQIGKSHINSSVSPSLSTSSTGSTVMISDNLTI